jgi:carotenoid cleavage dioxygenase-like enzyme
MGANDQSEQCTGLLEPVEERDFESLQVQGELPEELQGMFVRNGPNPKYIPETLYHSFQGDGMMHGVRLEGGRASYRNRYVETRGFLAERDKGGAIWGGAFDPPNLRNKPVMKNPANTHLVAHGGKFLALCEGGSPYEVSLPELSTVGEHHFDGKFKGAFTGHPKYDADTGEMMFFGYSFVPPFLRYGVLDEDGRLSHLVPVPLEATTMMHDFAVTEHYTIFLDLPLRMRLSGALKGTPINWEPERGARIGIMPRRGYASDVRWHEVDPCMVFHTVNAYEEGDTIVVDGCRMDSTTVAGLLDPKDVKRRPTDEPDVPRMHRWRIDTVAGGVKDEPLDDKPCDFPRIHPGYIGRKHRFAYTAYFADKPDPSRAILTGWLKYDHERGTRQEQPLLEGLNACEPVFVPRPGAVDEDDGWVLAFTGDRERGELVILNAQDFDGEPQARIQIPGRVPFGYHGDFFPRSTYA